MFFAFCPKPAGNVSELKYMHELKQWPRFA